MKDFKTGLFWVVVFLITTVSCKTGVEKENAPLIVLYNNVMFTTGNEQIVSGSTVEVGDTLFFILQQIDNKEVKTLRLKLSAIEDTTVSLVSATDSFWFFDTTLSVNSSLLSDTFVLILPKQIFPGLYRLEFINSDGEGFASTRFDLAINNPEFPAFTLGKDFSGAQNGKLNWGKKEKVGVEVRPIGPDSLFASFGWKVLGETGVLFERNLENLPYDSTYSDSLALGKRPLGDTLSAEIYVHTNGGRSRKQRLIIILEANE